MSVPSEEDSGFDIATAQNIKLEASRFPDLSSSFKCELLMLICDMVLQ